MTWHSFVFLRVAFLLSDTRSTTQNTNDHSHTDHEFLISETVFANTDTNHMVHRRRVSGTSLSNGWHLSAFAG